MAQQSDLVLAFVDRMTLQAQTVIRERCVTRWPLMIIATEIVAADTALSGLVSSYRRPLEMSTHSSDAELHHGAARAIIGPHKVSDSKRMISAVDCWISDANSFHVLLSRRKVLQEAFREKEGSTKPETLEKEPAAA